MAATTEPSGFVVAHGWLYLAGVYTGHSKIEVVWQCYQSPKFVSVFVWRNSVGGDSQFWWGIEFSANKLAGFDSRLVPIVKKLVKTLMCTFVHNKLLCTYVHIKPKNTLLSIVAPPGSHPYIRSILTKPMLQTIHLDPKLKVLYEEVGLWGEWWWSLPPLNLLCTYVWYNLFVGD